jgi:predicted GNAT family acetyltransferase
LKENRAAIKCYLKLGFRSHSRFAVTKLQRRR